MGLWRTHVSHWFSIRPILLDHLPQQQDHSFTNATGLGCELFGAQRLKRFSMLAEDGVVKNVNVENENNDLGVSSADHMLEVLGQ